MPGPPFACARLRERLGIARSDPTIPRAETISADAAAIRLGICVGSGAQAYPQRSASRHAANAVRTLADPRRRARAKRSPVSHRAPKSNTKVFIGMKMGGIMYVSTSFATF